MECKSLSIKGCTLITPKVFSDERGSFHEWFQDSAFYELTKDKFQLAQANCSVSTRGVVRGIHFAGFPPGQAKYVTCLSGKVFDVLVDFRIGSPTFGKWESVILDSKFPQMVYIPSGIGHGFMSLEEHSTFVYLCDQRYQPSNEFDVDAFDKDLGIDWPSNITPIRSKKDTEALSFKAATKFMPKVVDLKSI